jgi:hypothetical protein
MTRSITYTRPFMYPYQLAILNSKARFTITIAGTKVGKTASHVVWLFEQALQCKENQSVWWVAPTFAQAKIAFNRMKVQINDRGFFKANETNLVITLVTGAKIEFKTGEKPDNLFGDDVYAFVFDEFTRARENAWVAIRTTITSTGGKGKFIGNATSTGHWGYKLAMKVKGGELGEDYEYFKITTKDAAEAGMLTKEGKPMLEEMMAARLVMSDTAWRAMYMAEASENGANPFGLKYIAAICQPDLSTHESICYGIDVANKFDSTSIIGLDKLACVSHYHNFNKMGWPLTISTIKHLPGKPMLIDSTGVGDVVVADVQQVQTQAEGYIFTPQSKQRLMEGLALGIQSRRLFICDDGDVVTGTGKLRYQLEQFEVTYTAFGVKYSAPDGEHDDDVCALALAWDIWQRSATSGNISVW